MNQADLSIANAILGIDTLWGGDVMCPSGTGRFIADSWFSDEPLPAAYTHPTAARLRAAGGVTGKDSVAVADYLREMSARSSARWTPSTSRLAAWAACAALILKA